MNAKYFLPERLAQARNEKGLSQCETAKALGISRGRVANYEKGNRRPDPSIIKQMAIFYNVSADWLLGLTDDPRPSDKIIADAAAQAREPSAEETEWLNIYRQLSLEERNLIMIAVKGYSGFEESDYFFKWLPSANNKDM